MKRLIVGRPIDYEQYTGERKKIAERVKVLLMLRTPERAPLVGYTVCTFCHVDIGYTQRQATEIQESHARGQAVEYGCYVCLIGAGIGGPRDQSVHIQLDQDRP